MTGFDRFNEEWAADGVLGDPSGPQSDAGFAFLGQAPPTVELFNSMFRWNDEKDNYLYNQMASVFTWGGQTAAANNPNTLRDAIIGQQKIRLAANANYYIATTGNDSNDGSSGNPWLTLQHAWNYIAGKIDFNGYTVFVHVADGTYAGMTGAGILTGTISPNSVQFIGNTTTPANAIVTGTLSYAFAAVWGAQFSVRGFAVSATGSSDGQGVAIYTLGAGSTINYGQVVFGNCDIAHVYSSAGGIANAGANYTIAGNSIAHWLAFAQGNIITANSLTITLTGTPSFSTAFAYSGSNSTTSLGTGVTFSGSATGSRYFIKLISTLSLNGATLPGNSAGSTASGGQVE